MKQLTKEQQEQAVDILERVANDSPKEYYYDSAKAFLQSLKPKVYVCEITESGKVKYLSLAERNYSHWNEDVNEAIKYDSVEDARNMIKQLNEWHCNHVKAFILTE